MKACRKCSRHEGEVAFGRDSGTKSGYRSVCKICTSAYAFAHRRKNLEHVRMRDVAARKRRHEKPQNFEKTRSKRVAYFLMKKYEVTVNQYNDQFLIQKGLCFICNKSEYPRLLCVDHCHLTSKIRGLLCSKCNLGLGNFCDNTDLLVKAIQYLEAKGIWMKTEIVD